MPLYKYTDSGLKTVTKNTMASLGIRERDDLQRVLRDNIDAVSPDTLIVAEEFSNWQDSHRRIDLLGIDPDGTLVVIELKRTEDGGHMDLQAIRYAAMISTATYDDIVEIYSKYLTKNGRDDDARKLLEEHFDCDESSVGEKTRIVLVSADFNSEITTAVLWLNEQGLEVSCVRLTAYKDHESIYIDSQIIIPLPEASDYIVKKREKDDAKKAARRTGSRDSTQFIVSQDGKPLGGPLNKRHTMYEIVSRLVQHGISPANIQQHLGSNRFIYCSGKRTTTEEFAESDLFALRTDAPCELNKARFHTNDDQLFHFDGRTYIFSNQWGSNTKKIIKTLTDTYPETKITVSEA